MVGKRDNMNNKGQALIEFILILPVLLLILMAVIDIGNIFLKKYELNEDLETVTELYKNNDTKELGLYLANEDIKLEDSKTNEMITITLQKQIEINAPLLKNVLGKNYIIETSKTFYEEVNEQ